MEWKIREGDKEIVQKLKTKMGPRKTHKRNKKFEKNRYRAAEEHSHLQ